MSLRILFASCHGYIDPSSGAATATRDVLELLAARGHDCRALAMGILDYIQETTLGPVLDELDVPVHRARATLSRGDAVAVYDLNLGGVRVTVMPTVSSRMSLESPGRDESEVFLNLTDQVLARFRPHVLLTYGGHPTSLELMALARRRGIAVVFHLHNTNYDDRRAFADATAVLVPSAYARRYYAARLGLACHVLPPPLRSERVVAPDPAPRYLTFVNPLPAKGVAVFARIAAELDQRRPDIPLLVVEGRGGADGLARVDLDLSGLTNLHRMANTPDPRDFYRVSRALLVPSLVNETFGRVAAEALANGLPVLASDRGALPATLGDAGFVFTIPERYTSSRTVVPTAREVAPWVAVIERLWDDPAFEAAHQAHARAAARAWEEERIATVYEEFFAHVAGNPSES